MAGASSPQEENGALLAAGGVPAAAAGSGAASAGPRAASAAPGAPPGGSGPAAPARPRSGVRGRRASPGARP